MSCDLEDTCVCRSDKACFDPSCRSCPYCAPDLGLDDDDREIYSMDEELEGIEPDGDARSHGPRSYHATGGAPIEPPNEGIS